MLPSSLQLLSAIAPVLLMHYGSMSLGKSEEVFGDERSWEDV
jgi:hypothetical protein